jgi:hypothetical protein
MTILTVSNAVLVLPKIPDLSGVSQDFQLICESNDISDGYHTVDELYDHRVILSIGLFSKYPEYSWVADKHSDGTFFSDWMLLGMSIPDIGQVTYHIPEKYREMCRELGIPSLNIAPPFDGHSAKDVLKRLKRFLRK